MNATLTPIQAFNAMRIFLEHFYYKTSSDNLGSLLSDIQLFPDGGTWDPAIWEDWIILMGSEKKSTPLKAFSAMSRFLEAYCTNSSSKTIQRLLGDTLFLENNAVVNPFLWQLWMESIETVLKEQSTL